MGGFFGVFKKESEKNEGGCVNDLFYGTDYHSHLGTMRGGMAVRSKHGLTRIIHDIRNAQFRSKFDDDLPKLKKDDPLFGIGVISDFEDQPLIIGSHLGTYAIVTVGIVRNAVQLLTKAFCKKSTHFSEMSGNEVNPTELVATLINSEESFVSGIRKAQECIEGSCSILLLTDQGIYAARDRFGRTPVIVGKSETGYAVTMETTAFPNLNYEATTYLGPGEIVLINEDGVRRKLPPLDKLQICSFLWVYYGYPSSDYEDINVEAVRYKCGEALARNDDIVVDYAAGIPDSGTAHAMGYATEKKIPFKRPFVKYTPTWPRSFMPQDQQQRNLVAKMKLIPIKELIKKQRIVFCEDSIVRGTQLRDIVMRLFEMGAESVHMRPACPPLVYGCKFLNFSRSKSEFDLAARTAIKEMEGDNTPDLEEYSNPCSEKHCAMVQRICKKLNLTTLKYQRLDNLITSIGLPKEKLCTYCWDGKE